MIPEHDDHKCQGYLGNEPGSLERFYRCTMLVIWPSWAQLDVVGGREGFSRACEVFDHFRYKPTAELERNPEREALRTVSSCALRWADPYLWIRIVEACDVKLSADMIWKLRFKEAIDAFGLDTVAHFMERALDNQPNIEQKRAFVETLNMSVRIT
ncbi:hypothetical protein ONZ51_g8465 [Trametes cubensis]|uniref:Uncharacterized protein n=1 Tax=Trametes cubensis TaxID=1111947 RepID=A0AAD7TQL6_9APHY|nr:hypothetical protein ONZ51_g8465 [Trametes cubensis]